MEKMQDIRDLTDDQLEENLTDLNKELFELRFKQATGMLENSARIREIRKTIARIKTVQTERQNNA